jgi:hypothetical protein
MTEGVGAGTTTGARDEGAAAGARPGSGGSRRGRLGRARARGRGAGEGASAGAEGRRGGAAWAREPRAARGPRAARRYGAGHARAGEEKGRGREREAKGRGKTHLRGSKSGDHRLQNPRAPQGERGGRRGGRLLRGRNQMSQTDLGREACTGWAGAPGARVPDRAGPGRARLGHIADRNP